MRYADPERRVVPNRDKTVLVVDHNSPSLISLAEHLGAAPEGELLMAHSQSGAIDMARQHQPDVAIVARSLVATGESQLLPEFLKEVSRETKIIIAKDAQAATAGEARSSGNADANTMHFPRWQSRRYH